MYKTYLKIALRSCKSNGLFSILNILGLSIGLAVTILLFLFITNELKFDEMYSKKKDIYRVLLNTKGGDKQETWANVPSAVAPSMKATIPEIQAASRVLKHHFGAMAFIKANDQNFSENYLYWCDSEIFNIFDIPFIKGNAATALSRPNTVTLSASIAKKYFGDKEAIGQTIMVDNVTSLEVTGIYKDLPNNSSLDCNMIASFITQRPAQHPTWDNASFETFFLMNKGTSITNVDTKMQQVLNENVKPADQWFSLSLQPLERMHLYSASFSNSYGSRNGDINEVKSLSLLALVILLIACINYMNLVTARSQKKAKDVAINKTLGASANNIIFRFYTETGLLTLFSLLIGVILATMAVPLFNTLTGKHLGISRIYNLNFLLGLLVIWVVTTFVSGSYPALHLSRFLPKEVMQQSVQKGGFAALLRKGLVVLQFSCSVILIIGVIVVYKQLEYMRQRNLGYNPENVIAISTAAVTDGKQTGNLLNEFKALSQVTAVSITQGYPGMDVSGRTLMKNDADEVGEGIQTNRAGDGVGEVLQLKLLAGHYLPAVKAEGDTLIDVVLNKKAIDYLGLTPEQAIGKKVNMQLGDNAYIVGVVDNFNFESLHVPLGAYAFHNADSEYKQYLLARFRTGNLGQSIKQFESSFKKVIPNSAFEYNFLDKQLETLYEADTRTANVGLAFSLLAIFIACLGLFGLAAYTAEQRTKEIGIRKVLGASVAGITTLLSKDFMKLIFISLLIAFPISYLMMHRWLNDFAFRISIGWGIFILAGFISILIALVTIGFQAVKAALANPVKSLRSAG